MMTAFLSYELTYGKFYFSIQMSYGQGPISDVGEERRPRNNSFSLLNCSYDFVWYRLRAAGEQKFFWGFGLSIQNLEVKQKVNIAPGRYNEHKDEYFGLGPRFSALYRFSEGKILTGFDLCLTATLPGASQSIIKTEGVYSDKSYLLWVKLNWSVYCDYRLSRLYTVKLSFERETWVYGRKQQPQYELHHFFSGGAFVVNTLGLRLGYNF